MYRCSSLDGLSDSEVVSFIIIGDEMTPQSLLRQFVCIGPCLGHLFLGHGGESGNGVLDGVGHLGVIVVCTVNDFHPILYFASSLLHGVCPLSEPRQVCGDAWHLESDSFKRCVSPWFICDLNLYRHCLSGRILFNPWFMNK